MNTRINMTPQFEATYCSQCGGSFGPGNSGFSHCDQHTTPITYDSPHTVTLTVQDWLGIRTQLAFAEFNNRQSDQIATACVTRELLDKLRYQTQQAIDDAADAADAEDAA
jgi:hypothetical protein